ncbi:unnamed protein product [Gadus morhua 'NCC']
MLSFILDPQKQHFMNPPEPRPDTSCTVHRATVCLLCCCFSLLAPAISSHRRGNPGAERRWHSQHGPRAPRALSGKEETTSVWLRAGGVVRLTTPVRASTHTVPPPHHRPPSPRWPPLRGGGGGA